MRSADGDHETLLRPKGHSARLKMRKNRGAMRNRVRNGPDGLNGRLLGMFAMDTHLRDGYASSRQHTASKISRRRRGSMFYVRRGQKRSNADLYRGIRRNERG